MFGYYRLFTSLIFMSLINYTLARIDLTAEREGSFSPSRGLIWGHIEHGKLGFYIMILLMMIMMAIVK